MSMNGVNHTYRSTVLSVCASARMGEEWSFDNVITSSEYECVDLAYDPT